MYLQRNIKKVTKEEIEAAKKDPILFAELFFKQKPHWYQAEIMKAIAEEKDTVICASRQIGKSTAVAMAAVWYVVTKEDVLVLVVSYSKRQAQELYRKIKGFLMYHPQIESLIEKTTMTETELINGSRIMITAVGKGGLSSQGYSADLLIIDEADSLPDEVFGVIQATQASTGGATILISTPRRRGSTFHRIFQDAIEARKEYERGLRKEPVRSIEEGGTGFVAFHYDYTVGLNVFKPDGKPQISLKVIQREKRTKPKWQFEAEYLAKWSDDSSSYFGYDMITSAVKDYTLYERGLPNGKYYIGVDLAKHHDKTVIIVVEKQTEHLYRVVHIYSTSNRNWEEQIGAIEDIARRFPPEAVFIDKTSIGDVVLDILQNNTSSPLHGKIVGKVFTIQNKISLYSNLYRLFANKMLIIPNHKDLIDELLDLQYEKSPNSEYIKIHAPAGGYDDHVDALALACSFAETISIDEISIAVLSNIRRTESQNFRNTQKKNRDYFDFDPIKFYNRKRRRDYISTGLSSRRNYI